MIGDRERERAALMQLVEKWRKRHSGKLAPCQCADELSALLQTEVGREDDEQKDYARRSKQ